MSGMIASAVIGGVASNNAANKAADANRAAIEANAYQGKIATDQYERYKKTYAPLEDKMVADATNYASPEAYNTAAADAQAGVSSELGKAQDRLTRTPGFDPSSASAQSAQTNLALSGAAMGATAQNTARLGVKNTAYAHQLDALGLGKGLVTNASTGLARATMGGNALAASNNQQAGSIATGAGALVNGIAGGLQKVNWSQFGSGTPNGTTNTNQYSGGNDGYTMTNGESLGT